MCVWLHINLRVEFGVVTTFYTLVDMKSILFLGVALVIIICRDTACRDVGVVILSVSEESRISKTCHQTLHYVQGDRSNVILSVSEESQIPHSTFRTPQASPV